MPKIVMHEGPTPDLPSMQKMTLYARDGAFYSLDPEGNDIRLTRGDFGSDIDFYEGDNPPYFADVDVYGFLDAAGFPNDEDRDVLFKIDANAIYVTRGIAMTLIYTLSEASAGQTLNLRLDYVVHNKGELYNAGTPYGQTMELSLTAVQHVLYASRIFFIPHGHVSANTVEVECKLTRLGSSAADTYMGDFGLKHIVVGSL